MRGRGGISTMTATPTAASLVVIVVVVVALLAVSTHSAVSVTAIVSAGIFVMAAATVLFGVRHSQFCSVRKKRGTRERERSDRNNNRRGKSDYQMERASEVRRGGGLKERKKILEGNTQNRKKKEL